MNRKDYELIAAAPSGSLNDLVRHQIFEESGEIELGMIDRYIDSELNHMSNAELLERISNALEYRRIMA